MFGAKGLATLAVTGEGLKGNCREVRQAGRGTGGSLQYRGEGGRSHPVRCGPARGR